MTACPRCRAPVTDLSACPACDLDLAVMAEAMRPAAVPRLPFALLARLPAQVRRDLVRAIMRATRRDS